MTGGARLAARKEFERISEGIARTIPDSGRTVPHELAVPLVTGGIIEILT